MYQREFDKRLEQGLPRAVLLYGENDYLIDRYIDRYKKELDAAESMLSLYHDEYDFDRPRAISLKARSLGGQTFC